MALRHFFSLLRNLAQAGGSILAIFNHSWLIWRNPHPKKFIYDAENCRRFRSQDPERIAGRWTPAEYRAGRTHRPVAVALPAPRAAAGGNGRHPWLHGIGRSGRLGLDHDGDRHHTPR